MDDDDDDNNNNNNNNNNTNNKWSKNYDNRPQRGRILHMGKVKYTASVTHNVFQWAGHRQNLPLSIEKS